MRYTPICKPNQIVTGKGGTVVVTGWTPKEAISSVVPTETVAAIGNLYSPTRGINFLVRNLLANPQVNQIYILKATKEDGNAGSSQCLYDFFRHGVERSNTPQGKLTWKIKSSVIGYIDWEINFRELETLRQSIDAFLFTSISECLQAIRNLPISSQSVAVREKVVVPEKLQKSDVLPGELYGQRVQAETIADSWVKILHRIRVNGTTRLTGYDGKLQEIINLTTVVTNEPLDYHFPDPNYLPIDKKALKNYIPQILEDNPDRKFNTKYTYGQRLRSWFGYDQINQVVEKIIREPDTTSAVMSLWDVEDHIKGSSPCLNHIWVKVTQNFLSLTATFRSNDMFSAWVSNAMGLRELQKHILSKVNEKLTSPLSLGNLITISQSAHIYEECWESSDEIINKYYKPRPNYNDSVGNFIITVKDKITVEQTTPGSGEAINSYCGKKPLFILRDIVNSNPSISPTHSGYLGIELEKAYQCLLKGNLEYTQDKELCF